MALCAVFELPDGSVAVTHPSARVQRPNESDAAFAARLDAESDRAYTLRRAQQAREKIPALNGCQFVLMDTKHLPADYSTRSQWRLKGHKVVVDDKQGKEKKSRE